MNHPPDKIAVGIDIGSSKITVAVSQLREGLVNIIGIGTAPNSGLRRGVIVDHDEVISSLAAALEEAERISGAPINQAVIGYGGAGIVTSISKGVVAVSRPDGEVNDEDVTRVVESARSVAMPPNQEIIHLFPVRFIIDSQEVTKDPRGMRAIRLESETIIIGAPSANIKSLSRVVEQVGVNIAAIIYNPFASARALLNKKQKDSGVILIDIGATTTSTIIFEEGELVDAHVIPIGSTHITNDIAIGLKTTLETAEKIKCHNATADIKKAKQNDKLDLRKISETEEGVVSQKFVAEIIDARLKEIFGMVRKELKKAKKDSMLPAGAVLTGGGAKLKGIIAEAKEILHLPAQIGVPSIEVGGAIDKLDDPSYSTSVGLSLLGLEIGAQEIPGQPLTAKFKNFNIGGVVGRAKQLFKQLLP